MDEFFKTSKIENVPRQFTVDELIPFWEKIVAAIKAAPQIDEYQDESNKRDDREAQYIRGELGQESLEQEADFEPNVVTFPDFETLLAAFAGNEILSKFLSEEQLLELIEHERAHLETAQKHGYNTEIGLSICRTSEGGYVFSPFVSVSVDFKGVDEADVQKHLKDISSAPGHDISESDKRKL
ncbi:MAG: hypothetical protein HYV53_04560 [Parcubacteria group bacterium]|nr:hypothetical protein [Parcubacteria group bacterium]